MYVFVCEAHKLNTSMHFCWRYYGKRLIANAVFDFAYIYINIIVS